MNPIHPQLDPIYRADTAGLLVRADTDASGATLFGHFCRFDDWNEIDSYFEGRFLEKVAPGAFTKTIAERGDRVVCSFDHGFDMSIGDKPLGPVAVLREEAEGPYYEVPLLDTDYNRDFVLPALQGRLMDGRTVGSTLGASYRFRVIVDEWNDEPERSDHNPEGIPERTIKEVRLYEFGPVVYPADPTATAGVRSLTDHYTERARQRAGISPTDREAASGTSLSDEPQKHSRSTTNNPLSAAAIKASRQLITRKDIA